MQPEWSRVQSPGPQREESPKIGASIKRSSWNAGMAADFAQMAPPGSPAAWQGRRMSQNRAETSGFSSKLGTEPPFEFPRIPEQRSSELYNRSRSPIKGSQHLQVPSLESIRSVSGSALTPGMQIDDTPLRSVLGSRNSSNSSINSSIENNNSNIGSNIGTLNGNSNNTNNNNNNLGDAVTNPFKFTSTYVTPSTNRVSRSSANKRRGHHYKHSSVSLNFFQEPEERAPLAIPVSLAVPTLAEYWQSITPPQAVNLAWCAAKLCVALACYAVGSPVHSMALLSHMLAYETVVSTTIALVAILSNFEVWSKSSLRLPFALKRVEVLVAFGLAVVLLFIGGDVISHIAQDWATGGDAHHHDHSHDHGHDHSQDRLGSGVGTMHYALVTLAIAMSLPTAWRHGTSNVLALSTVLFALVVLVIPLFPHQLSSLVDMFLQPAIVATMVYVGYTSSKLFGGMLAMSYGGPDRSNAISALVSSDPCVVQVEEISLWQVHHDLWLATMRIIMSGTADDERRVRLQAARAVREAVDVQDVVWQTTIEIHRADIDYF